MRMIVVFVALATPGLAFAAESNPKASLSCELVDEGRRTRLPVKRVRTEAPIECKVSVAGAPRPAPFTARIVTAWTDDDAGKAVKKRSDRHTGQVNGGAPWTAKLAPDQDFVGCIDFTIEAVLTTPGADAKPAWSKKISIKQYCPD